MGVTAAVVALAGVAHSTNEQRKASDDARRAGRKSSALEAKRQQLQVAKQRRQQIRESQIAQANINAQAGASGTAQTSGVAQGTGSIRSRTASNLSFLNANEGITASQNIFNVQAGRAMSDANRAAGRQQLFGSIFSTAVSAGAFKGSGGTNPASTTEINRPDSTVTGR